MKRFFPRLAGVVACLFVLVALPAAATPAAAQAVVTKTAKELEPVIDGGTKSLNAVETLFENGGAPKINIAETRATLGSISEKINAASPTLTALRQTVSDQLAALGPVPAEGQAPEPEEIATERKQLNERLVRIEGLIKRIEVLNAQILLLNSRLTALSRSRFLDSVFDRGPWPLSPTVWADAGKSLQKAADETRAAVTAWYAQRQEKGRGVLALSLLAGGLALVALFTLVFRAGVNKQIIALAIERRKHRVWIYGAALLRFFNGLFWVTTSGAVLYSIAEFQGLISIETRNIALAVIEALLIIFVGREIAKAAFSPKRAFIRPLALSNRQANSVYLAFTVSLVLVALDLVGRRSSVALETGLNLAVAQSFIVSVIIAVVLLPLSRPRLWIPARTPEAQAGDEPAHPSAADTLVEDISGPKRGMARLIAIFGLVFSIGIVIAALFGYAALARFSAEKATYLIGLSLTFLLLRGFFQSLADDWVAKTLKERSGGQPGSAAPASDDQNEPESFLGFWVGLSIDSILFAFWLPFVLLIAGVDWPDIKATVLRLLTGIQIGPVTISFGDLLSAIVIFVIGIFLTRIIQKTLEHRILPKTSLNYGARSSVTTLLGYVGILAACLMAISVAGLDLSNLAIIAGALSVGIGFGLQSIVSNFVSGLILLFERPIKIGDWIVTSAGEGIVKRISVRATEIETFERQSIIVPNSEIITASVANWSHRDRIARATIPVGVSYNSDVRQVERILREVAEKHPRVLSYPAPFIYFADYGDSALMFELRAFVRDNNYLLSVKNDLRFAVWDRLKEAGVEIPFPQRDIHIRSGLPDMGRMSVQETPSGPGVPEASASALARDVAASAANRDGAVETPETTSKAASQDTVVVAAGPACVAEVKPPVTTRAQQPGDAAASGAEDGKKAGGLLGLIGIAR